MRSQQITVTTTNGLGQLLGANPKRRAIIVSTDGVSNISLTFGFPSTALATGIFIGISMAPVLFTREMIGDQITQPIYFAQGAANKNANVIEMFD